MLTASITSHTRHSGRTTRRRRRIRDGGPGWTGPVRVRSRSARWSGGSPDRRPARRATGPVPGPRTPRNCWRLGRRAVLDPGEEPAGLPGRLLADLAHRGLPLRGLEVLRGPAARAPPPRARGAARPRSFPRRTASAASAASASRRAGGVGAHGRVDLVERPGHRLVLGLQRLDQRRVDAEVHHDREQDGVLLLVVVAELVAQVAPGAAEVGRTSAGRRRRPSPGHRRVGPGLVVPRRGSPCSSSP